MSPAAAFVRPPSTQEAVLVELRRRIVAGELTPGDRVVAETVGAELGVSRVPVREALKILAGEGQVVYEPHRGYFVARLSVADLRELYRMRELLEAEALRAAVPRLGHEQLDRVADDLARADEASAGGDLIAYADANRDFHFDVFESSGRPLLVRTIRQLWDASDAYRALYANAAEHRAAAAAEHRAILAALAAGDVHGAIAAQDAHRQRALTVLAQMLPASPSAAGYAGADDTPRRTR